ncbi:MAG TPA: tRNA lysidine(34) synthetase TilS [Candidatus Saccharimonadales bacterium]|nr:tRNA lysidine(34) synthetase TilS [Candidatus Saccharimonadales bacterium]
MDISIKPGRYVIAVSGGVDSMVLLDLLHRQPGVELIVVHLDHGIRPDAALDRKLVQSTALLHGLPFVYKEAQLGAHASEADARTIRYDFLHEVQRRYQAKAIITAHHRDDVLETALLNVLRGTGRKGLSSLQSSPGVVRPLLAVSKSEILEYARQYHLQWREDSTNQDDRYARNYIRHNFVTRLSAAQAKQLLSHIHKAGQLNTEIDGLLLTVLGEHTTTEGLDRRWFTQLPYAVAAEVIAAWLRDNGVREFSRKLVNQLVVTAKTAQPDKLADVDAEHALHIRKSTISLEHRKNLSR